MSEPQINTKFDILKPEYVDAAVNAKYKEELFSDRIWTNKADMIDKLQSSIVGAMKGDVTIDKIGQQISNTFNSTAYESQRLVNTEVARVQTQASEDMGRDTGVEQVMWSATLENNTCDECAALDGNTYPIDDAPDCPAHPECVCCLINVPYEGWSPTSRKDNETGDIIDYTNYTDWAKEKDVSDSFVTNASQLPKDDLKIIDSYSQQAYSHINGYLRGGYDNPPDWVAGYADKLETILSKSKLSEDVSLYRGGSSKIFGDLTDIIKSDPTRAIGTEITDKGFMSTSKQTDVAEKFVGKPSGAGGNHIMLEIKAPKGYSGLELGKLSFHSEDEVILKNGTKIKITGVEDTRKTIIQQKTTYKAVNDLSKPLGNTRLNKMFGIQYEQKQEATITDEQVKTGYIKFIGEVVK
jgi:SPP1 gp7 family putative phage head morphogenesis protein